MNVVQHIFFVLRNKHYKKFSARIRNWRLSILGMSIGNNTFLPKIYVTWPHQVKIGNNCSIEHSVYFKYDGIWKPGPSIKIGDNVFIGANCEFNITLSVEIGDNSLIASGCKFIDHNHGVAKDTLMRSQPCPQKEIKIGSNVWLGTNTIVLKGVEIGDGAIVAAGAVVTKNILQDEIWAGVPAKKINTRK